MYTLLNIISSLIVWGAVSMIALRVFSNSGIALNDNKFFNSVLADRSIKSGFDTTKNELIAVFSLALLFRALVFILSIFAIFIVNNKSFSIDELLKSYVQWDAHNYERIALGGYSYHTENGKFTTLAFFPLYPYLMRFVNVFLHNLTASGILLSCVFYSGACAFMYKLLSLDYNKQTSIRAIVYMSVLPHSLFFGAVMNESLLLFMSMATLYYIRKHDWVKVGVFGALAAVSRMSGLLLAIPAAAEWLEEYKILQKLRSKQIKEVFSLFLTKGIWIFLMLLGTGIYLLCNFRTSGEWFKFLEYQDEIWNQKVVYFGKSIADMLYYAVNAKTSSALTIHIPQLASVAFVISMILYGLRTTRSMYTAFLVAYLIFNTSVSWPISLPRYITCAVPAFIILSDFSERHKWTEHIITPVMAIAMGIFFTAYFMSKQIL